MKNIALAVAVICLALTSTEARRRGLSATHRFRTADTRMVDVNDEEVGTKNPVETIVNLEVEKQHQKMTCKEWMESKINEGGYTKQELSQCEFDMSTFLYCISFVFWLS